MSLGAARSALGWSLAGAVVLAIAGAERAVSQVPACSPHNAALPAGVIWPAPLDRVVQVPSAPMRLGDALDWLARDASIRFTYSPELLPLTRSRCLTTGARAAGGVLAELLSGTGVTAVVAGADQVVLTPSRPAAGMDAMADARPSHLERVVVTGTAVGSAERSSPVAVTVVQPTAAAARAGTPTLATMLDGTTPGIWLWRQSPATPLGRYGSIRGASSFGLTTPKVYVDGIALANPLLLSQLDPARVQRIEVIRGPQGAALYGADAISGVVNVVTRFDGDPSGGAHGDVLVSAGGAASDYTTAGVLSQRYGAVGHAGSGTRSAAFGATASTFGAYVPGASARSLLASGGVRRVGAASVLTGTAAIDASDGRQPVSPLLVDVGALADSASRQSLLQYTLGGSATIQRSSMWTHVVMAGINGFVLHGVASDDLPVPSPVDSALRAARGNTERTTLRLNSTRREVDSLTGRVTSVTFGFEQATTRQRTTGADIRLAPTGGTSSGTVAQAAPRDAVVWSTSTGALIQTDIALRNAVFLRGGLRLEHVTTTGSAWVIAALPTLGAAWAVDVGRATLKLRTAYGRGIRPARSVARGSTWMGASTIATGQLEPERQSGTEHGADLLWQGDGPSAPRVALHATRFDQRAAGLVQPVAVLDTAYATPGERWRLAYLLQNVGEIDNGGWELEASTGRGPLSAGATLSLVDSRVRTTVPQYQGDMQPRDRMLGVPARTFGLIGSWAARQWTVSATVSRAEDWINYDRVALANALATASSDTAGGGASAPLGSGLRQYWIRYPGVTRAGVRAAVTVWHGAALTLDAENLLNAQRGEPDNATVLPGRTITIGVRTRL